MSKRNKFQDDSVSPSNATAGGSNNIIDQQQQQSEFSALGPHLWPAVPSSPLPLVYYAPQTHLLAPSSSSSASTGFPAPNAQFSNSNNFHHLHHQQQQQQQQHDQKRPRYHQQQVFYHGDEPLRLEDVLLRPERAAFLEQQQSFFIDAFGHPLSSSSSSSFLPPAATAVVTKSILTQEKDAAKERKAILNSMGEHRLKIFFSDLGEPGNPLQVVRLKGKPQTIIPHGLCGTTEVYGETWMLIVHHVRSGEFNRNVVQWSITNMNSQERVVRMETEEEAITRETQGRTVCNQVLKQAMDMRARSLEHELSLIPRTDTSAIAKLESKIKALRPKRLLIGPLFFGLQHQSIQEAMNEKLMQQRREFPEPTD